MKIGLVVSNSMKDIIKNNLRVLLVFGSQENDIFFDEIESMEQIIQADRIVTDENDIRRLSLYDFSEDILDKIYLWESGFLIPIRDKTLLNAIQKQAFDNKNWGLVKKINQMKLELNYLMEETCLDTFPSTIQMESTSFCNARCIMCSHLYAGNDGACDISDEMLAKIEPVLPYVKTIILHGNGEPFLSKNFEKSMELYEKYKIKLTTNTNLSILNEKIIRKINQSFHSIHVSCDACEKAAYEQIRKNLSFEIFVENAKNLCRCCPDVYKNMVCVVMRQNLGQMAKMVSFAAELGFSSLTFLDMGPNVFINNEMDKAVEYPYSLAAQIEKAIDYGTKLGIKVILPENYLEICEKHKNPTEQHIRAEQERIFSKPFYYTDEEIQQMHVYAERVVGDQYRVYEDMAECSWENNIFSCSGICEWCMEKTYLDVKGNVYVCCINSSYRLGNILDATDFSELWNNEIYRKIRQSFHKHRLPGFCNNCQFVINDTLKRLRVHVDSGEFYQRKRISKFYKDYVQEHNNDI